VYQPAAETPQGACSLVDDVAQVLIDFASIGSFGRQLAVISPNSDGSPASRQARLYIDFPLGVRQSASISAPSCSLSSLESGRCVPRATNQVTSAAPASNRFWETGRYLSGIGLGRMRSGDDYEYATPLGGKAPHGLFDEAGDLTPGRVGTVRSTEERG